MYWILGIGGMIILLVAWVLLSELLIEVDTRVPEAGLRWGLIGKAKVWYDQEWWLSFQVLFFRKSLRMASIKRKPAKKQLKREQKEPRKRKAIKHLLKRALRTLKTVRVLEWKLAIDSGDQVSNAQLYPLNFLTPLRNHLMINFRGENFLLLKVKSHPWKILYAFFK